MHRLSELLESGFLFFALLMALSQAKLFKLNVLERDPVCEVEDRFISVAVGMSNAQNSFQRIDYTSEKLKALLKALKPAYLRLGGSASNFVFFKVGAVKPTTPPTFPSQQTAQNNLTGSQGTASPPSNALPTAKVPTTANPTMGNSPPGVTNPPTAKPTMGNSLPGAKNPPKKEPVKATPFTPHIPEKPTDKPGPLPNPQTNPGQTQNGQNEDMSNQSGPNQPNTNPNQNQNTNQGGQVPNSIPNPSEPNKPVKPEEDGPLFVDIQGKDPQNPSDALQDFTRSDKKDLTAKTEILASGSGEGSGQKQDGNGLGEESSSVLGDSSGSNGSGSEDYSVSKSVRRSIEKRGKVSQPFWLMSDDFDKFHNFMKDAGLDIVFNLGNFVRYSNGSWNATNALEMLHHIAYRGYNIGWHLGNEPNSYKKYGPERVVNATQAGKDAVELRRILRSNAKFGTLLVGPDVTRPRDKGSSEKYLKEYLKTNASSEISAVSWHQYYVDGRTTTQEEMLSPKTLDVFKDQIQRIKRVMKEENTTKPLWLTETGSAYGGGAPGISDTFAASFTYLDKLGLSGVFCNSVVMRQSFVKGSYAMLDDDYTPRPDYWLALLHKRLVGRRVLLVSGDTKRLRAYAHCTRKSSAYQPGAVTLMVINLRDKPAQIELGNAFEDKKVDQFLVTSADGSLATKQIMLNGEKLQMRSNSSVPNLPALNVQQPMKMPSYSYAFYVIPDAGVKHCL